MGVNPRLGGVGEFLKEGGVAFEGLLDGLIGADGGFEGDFLGEQKGSAAVDDGMVFVAEHFIEGEIGESGGFAGLAFPEESPETGVGVDKFAQDFPLVGPTERFLEVFHKNINNLFFLKIA